MRCGYLTLLCATVLLAACSKSENAGSGAAEAAKVAPGEVPGAGTNEVKSEPSATATATAEPAGASVGVPECDQYVAKYTECLGKMPEEKRDPFKDTLAKTVEAWKELAADAEQGKTLAEICRNAAEGAKKTLSDQGCTTWL